MLIAIRKKTDGDCIGQPPHLRLFHNRGLMVVVLRWVLSYRGSFPIALRTIDPHNSMDIRMKDENDQQNWRKAQDYFNHDKLPPY